MNNNQLINNAYKILKNHFKNTRVLSLSELLFILQSEQAYPKDQITNVSQWYHHFFHMDYLKKYENATEFFIGKNQYVLDSQGHQYPLKNFINPEFHQFHFEILCHQNNISWNYSTPYASFQAIIHGQKYRATLIHQSISPINKPSLFLRKINLTAFPLENYIPQDFYTPLKKMLTEKKNILVCGATGSGKTSFLSSFMQFIPKDQHTIILEDTKELLAPPHCTELLANSQQGKRLVDFCHYSLRMSPQRIIIGEMRSQEIVPFLLMMNTGHNGLMSTVHANSAVDALTRCAFLFTIYGHDHKLDYEDILKLVCKNIDYVIYMKDKKIQEVIQVLGSEKKNCFYETVFSTTPHLHQREIFL